MPSPAGLGARDVPVPRPPGGGRSPPSDARASGCGSADVQLGRGACPRVAPPSVDAGAVVAPAPSRAAARRGDRSDRLGRPGRSAGRGASPDGPSDGSSSGASAGSSSGASAGSSSRTQPPDAERRARRWYSGPCLRGSAYSFGLIVQYVPLEAPYHVAPVQPGSKGSSSAASYEVEPGVARFDGRRRPPVRRDEPGSSARPGSERPPVEPSGLSGSSFEAAPWAGRAPGEPLGREPGVGRRALVAPPDARARSGSARHGSPVAAGPGREPGRRLRFGAARAS